MSTETSNYGSGLAAYGRHQTSGSAVAYPSESSFCSHEKNSGPGQCGSVGWALSREVAKQKVTDLVSSHSTCLGCGFSPW